MNECLNACRQQRDKVQMRAFLMSLPSQILHGKVLAHGMKFDQLDIMIHSGVLAPAQMLDGERDSLDVTTAQLSQPGPAQATLKGYLRNQPVPTGMGSASGGSGQASMTSFLKPGPGSGNVSQKRPLPDVPTADAAPSKQMRR